MKNSIKPLNILGMMLLAIILFTSCSNDDDNPTIVTTYKLIMSATPPTQGNTLFTITYNDKEGVTQTLTDTSGTFEKSFDIEEDYNILFNVSGTNDLTDENITPIPNIYWAVSKFENNVEIGTICFSNGSLEVLRIDNGVWTFTSNHSSTFNGTSCN